MPEEEIRVPRDHWGKGGSATDECNRAYNLHLRHAAAARTSARRLLHVLGARPHRDVGGSGLCASRHDGEVEDEV